MKISGLISFVSPNFYLGHVLFLRFFYRLVLRCVEPLLRSRNSAVVLAVISLFHSLAPTCDVARAMKSLVRLLRSQFEVQWVVLQVIASVIHLFSDTFRPYIKDFYVKGIDSSDVACCKLHIITRLVDSSNFAGVLLEPQACIRHCIDDVACAAVRTLGQCAQLLPSVLPSCVAGFMQLVKTNANTNVLPECVVVVRALVASKPDDNYKLIHRLARMFSSLSSSAAKAVIIWMVAEYGQVAGVNSLELLRVCARSFASEIPLTKLQILSFASNSYAAKPEESRLLYKYIVSLANADVAFDIRDLARMIHNILGSGDEGEDDQLLSSFAVATVCMNKVVPVVPPVHSVPATTFSLERMSFCLGKLTSGYKSPAPFPITAPDGCVRDVSSKSGAKSAAVPSLHAFYVDKEKSSGEDSSNSGSNSSSDATSSSGSMSFHRFRFPALFQATKTSTGRGSAF
jgi:AP-3 complex subunit beta